MRSGNPLWESLVVDPIPNAPCADFDVEALPRVIKTGDRFGRDAP